MSAQCVLLLVIFLAAACLSLVSEGEEVLWVSNPSGIFSQFLQLRQMLRNAERHKLGRVVLSNFTSTHFNTSHSLCDMFDLARSVSCNISAVTNVTLSTCLKTMIGLGSKRAKLNSTSMCFRGQVFGSKGTISKTKRLQLMTWRPKLAFAPRYVSLYRKRLQPLLISRGGGNNFTVVHWRRGDQLSSRCKSSWGGLRDTTVNCAGASEFLADVRSHQGGDRGQRLFVATNERDAAVLAELRRAEGVTLLSDLITSIIGPHPGPASSAAALDARELEAFLLEALAMLYGPVLLTIGVSTVNDLLESTRKAEGRSYCTRTHDEVDSWCALVKGSGAPPASREVGNRNNTRTTHKAKAAKAKAKISKSNVTASSPARKANS
jgi:hypothetical protein